MSSPLTDKQKKIVAAIAGGARNHYAICERIGSLCDGAYCDLQILRRDGHISFIHSGPERGWRVGSTTVRCPHCNGTGRVESNG